MSDDKHITRLDVFQKENGDFYVTFPDGLSEEALKVSERIISAVIHEVELQAEKKYMADRLAEYEEQQKHFQYRNPRRKRRG